MVGDETWSAPKMETRLAVESLLIVFGVFAVDPNVVRSVGVGLGYDSGRLATGAVAAADNGGLVAKKDCRFLGVKAPEDAALAVPASSRSWRLDFGNMAVGGS